MNIRDTLMAFATYFVAVVFVYLASWMSGMPMDSLVGWVAMGMAAGAGARR